jgi:uncharacterized protein
MTSTAIRDDDSAPFFDATAEDRLLIRRCTSCGHALAPEARTCHRCGGAALAWVEATGEATVVTWTVAHRRTAAVAGSGDQGPAVLALVELAEGPWLAAPLLDVDPATLAVGEAVVVAFVRPGGGEAIPAFRRPGEA